MKFNFLYFIIIFVSFKFILNGDPVSELKADEETESDCYKTANPQSKNDCLEREVAEGDSYCCLFEGFYVRIKAASGQGMVDFLAQCGKEIKVVSPPHLIDSLKLHMKETLILYEND